MFDTIQKKLEVIRPPRVKIEYEVETGGAGEVKELPYVLGIMADLSGKSTVERAPLKDRKFIQVSNDTLKDIMTAIAPRVEFTVDDKIGGKGQINVDLTFRSMDDFEPLSIIDQIEVLKNVFASRTRLNDLLAKLDGNYQLNSTLDDVLAGKSKKSADQLVKDGNMVRDPSQADYAKELINEFNAIPKDSTKSSISLVTKQIAKLDGQISAQLDEILHHEDFQQMEGTWRGMFMLVTGTDTGAHVQIRLMNIAISELAYDLEKAIEFDQSQIFKKVYEEEYGTFGGNPYTILMSDHNFGRNNADMELLRKISQVAAAAHAPFISAAHPSLLDLDNFTQLGNIRDIATVFNSTELGKWMSFRETEESRYVALTLPHVLARAPYGEDTNPVYGLNYEENVDGTDNSKFCWTSSSWALALRVLESANMTGWPASIRGVENGGMVSDLPYYTFKTTDGDIALKCPTEVSITDRREKELSDQGLIPLCHCKNRDYAVFFGSQTAHKPTLYDTAEANSNSNLSARLSYMLAACRFAHYIKVMVRDKIGNFMERSDLERYLNNWVASYVLLNPEASEGAKARFPLRAGRVDVYDIPGQPGNYKAIIFLRPHFQLEELTASIRLVADLPKPLGEQVALSGY
jgi:type VI secretion system protein ImpC